MGLGRQGGKERNPIAKVLLVPLSFPDPLYLIAAL
jgi:hypothetical protein